MIISLDATVEDDYPDDWVGDDDGYSPVPPLHLSNYYNNEYVGTLGIMTPLHVQNFRTHRIE